MANNKSDNKNDKDHDWLGGLLHTPSAKDLAEIKSKAAENVKESTQKPISESKPKSKPEPKPKTDEVGEKPTKKEKIKTENFTLTIHPDTLQKFNEIQWLKQFIIDFSRVTRDDVLKEALDALGEKMGYDELMKQHKDKMKGNISPPPGRTAK
mgnify:CR=1 FL=1|tara:strand:+ start:6629 stop:7087 length:459 start_codon:yes stop_codon:yes gene_type:complete